MEKRYTVCVDFDGVLHSYVSPWVAANVIPDPPVDGAIEWLHRTIQDFDVAILSTRNQWWRGRWAMRAWLREHGGNLYNEGPGYVGIEDVTFPAHKPAALVYIDDRALRFTGPESWPTKTQIHLAKPWNKT